LLALPLHFLFWIPFGFFVSSILSPVPIPCVCVWLCAACLHTIRGVLQKRKSVLEVWNPPNFPFKLYLLFYNEICHCLFNNSFSVLQDARELCSTLIKKKKMLQFQKFRFDGFEYFSSVKKIGNTPAQTVIQEWDMEFNIKHDSSELALAISL
jgi:hypothetical protein